MKLKKMLNKQENNQVNKQDATQESNSVTRLDAPKSLFDIVDRQRPYTMLFSGAETYFNFLYENGVRNFLATYHYIQKKHLNISEFEEKNVKFFIDSGAFTYRTTIEFQEYTVEQWEKQIQRYLKWAEKHKSIIFAIANLDIEGLVDGEKVQEWNEKYFEPFMLRTGIPVCFIHHEDSKLSWEQYCQRYPYTGFSWGGVQNNDIQFGLSRLQVAEKYNTLVHGMAMTKTSLLTKLPFYTTDSTTWLVGTQYGEINFWTGKSMTRLKKEKWKGSYFNQLVDKGLDADKLENEDIDEMLRANVHAFLEAEEYIQDKLKSRMYWLKPQKVKRTEDSIKDLNFPSVEWCRGSNNFDGWEEYAKEFNITTESDMRQEAVDNVLGVTLILNWDNDTYKEVAREIFNPDCLKYMHDTYINRIVQSDEERIEDLRRLYTDVLLGKEDKLLLLGTNFDRITKERNENDYITDDEYDLVDASKMEVDNLLSKYLPPPKEGESAPEIDSLDDEIFSDLGIVPVRDEKGRFIKGQKKIKRPKKLYSNKYPKMSCDYCFNAQKCPQYKEGYVCAYNKMFDRYNTRDMSDIIQAMQGIVDYSMQRLQRGMLTEVLEGGLPDPNVTGMMNQTMGYLAQLQKMYECGSQEVLRQTKVMRSDGTQEITTQVSNPQSGGILAQIFGNMSSNDDKTKEDDKKENKSEEIVVEPKE